MSYIGNTPTTQSFISGTDYFNGTGAQTAFTLSRTVASVNDIQAVVNNVVQVPNDAYTISGTTITFTSAPSAGTQNVYVRYLSTTTQSITPSQNTVSWSTLDSNVQGDLGISFKNRIINGAMVISQRNGTSAVTIDGGASYTLDRYLCQDNTDGSYTVVQSSTAPTGFTNSLLVTITGTDSSLTTTQFGRIVQRIEGFNTADLGWGTANAKTVTLSFWVRSSVTGTFSGTLVNNDGNRIYAFTYTINSANTWEYETITIAGDASGTWATNNTTGIELNLSIGAGPDRSVTAGSWGTSLAYAATGQTNLFATNGATFYITGVQLEVGTQATTFTTAGGSYGAELALCQRYFQVYGGNVDNEGISSGVLTDTTEAQTILAFKVEMRANPTGSSPSSAANSFVFRGAWGAEARTSSNLAYSAGARGTNIQVSTSGKTAGQAGILRVGTDLGKIFFSAEL